MSPSNTSTGLCRVTFIASPGRLVLAILLGAVLSQAIAFRQATSPASPVVRVEPLPDSELGLPSFLRASWPAATSGAREVRAGHECSVTTRCCPYPGSRGGCRFVLITESYGWPARSLVIYRATAAKGPHAAEGVNIQDVLAEFRRCAGGRAGIPVGEPAALARLPVWPIWPGLAVNMALFAPAMWAASFVPLLLLRLRRHRPGQCSACGYDLRGNESGICPECGMPAPRRPVEHAGDER